MRFRIACVLQMVLVGSFGTSAIAQDLVQARDGSGVFGYKHTPIQPWSGYHVHDPDRPLPARVQVGETPESSAVPSDAIVLFDGTDAAMWEASDWRVVDGCLEAASGGLTSKRTFSDCQIHLEWQGPTDFEGPWYNQGNSGVNLMGLYEIQIFDSHNVPIYPDGMAGAIYGQTPPLVNASLPPGHWQSFDIIFQAPVFENDILTQPARVTVFHNGVLVQDHEEIHGEVAHTQLPEYKTSRSEGPVVLTGHNCPLKFRNVWVRPL